MTDHRTTEGEETPTVNATTKTAAERLLDSRGLMTAHNLRGEARRRAEMQRPTWTPAFSHWRHGGYYVENIVTPNGASGCVARVEGGYTVACNGDTTVYPDRKTAAYAERAAYLATERERQRNIQSAEYALHIGLDARSLYVARAQFESHGVTYAIDGDGWESWGQEPGSDANDHATMHVVVYVRLLDAGIETVKSLVGWLLVPFANQSSPEYNGTVLVATSPETFSESIESWSTL